MTGLRMGIARSLLIGESERGLRFGRIDVELRRILLMNVRILRSFTLTGTRGNQAGTRERLKY